MKSVKVFAPASVSNVGPGFDILGFAINKIGDTITVSKGKNLRGIKITKADANGIKLPKEINKNTAGVAAKALCKDFDITGIEIEIQKNYGVGTGLGSSAASAVGVVYAINKLFNLNLSKLELIRYAMEGESIASGSYHADNVAPSMLGGVTLIHSYEPLSIVKIKPKLNLVCGIISPDIIIQTKEAREVLKKNLPLKKLINQTGNIAGLISALYEGDHKRLKQCLVDVVVEPQRAKLIPFFRNVKDMVLSSDALGCSISGSGPAIFFFHRNKDKAMMILNKVSEFYSGKNIKCKTNLSTINNTGVREIK